VRCVGRQWRAGCRTLTRHVEREQQSDVRSWASTAARHRCDFPSPARPAEMTQTTGIARVDRRAMHLIRFRWIHASTGWLRPAGNRPAGKQPMTSPPNVQSIVRGESGRGKGAKLKNMKKASFWVATLALQGLPPHAERRPVHRIPPTPIGPPRCAAYRRLRTSPATS
jgi:hypothetical protein